MRTTLKVAELATFIYAILVFGSICIEMAYFSSFDISIAAYFNISEILLLFLNKPLMYLPIVIVFATMYVPLFGFNNLRHKGIKSKYEAFANYSLLIMVTNTIVIGVAAYLYGVLYSVSVIFVVVLAEFLLFLPNSPMLEFKKNLKREYRKLVGIMSKLQSMLWKRSSKCKYSWRNKLEAQYKRNAYIRSKNVYNLINALCANTFLYGIVVSYILIVVGFSIVNLTRAGAYIDNELSPDTVATYTTPNKQYVCNNISYFLIAESADYVFVYDRGESNAIVIPRNEILSTSYSLKHKEVVSRKSLEPYVRIKDTE